MALWMPDVPRPFPSVPLPSTPKRFPPAETGDGPTQPPVVVVPRVLPTRAAPPAPPTPEPPEPPEPPAPTMQPRPQPVDTSAAQTTVLLLVAGPGDPADPTTVNVASGGVDGAGADGASASWTDHATLVSIQVPAGARVRVELPAGSARHVTRVDRSRQLALAVEFDDPVVVAGMVSSYQLTPDDVRAHDNHALRRACEAGRAGVAAWLVETYALGPRDARAADNYCLRAACRAGNLELAMWLKRRFGLTPDDARAMNNYALRMACRNGHLEVCRWLRDEFQLGADDAHAHATNVPALSMAAAGGHEPVVRWLLAAFDLERDPRTRAADAIRVANAHGQPGTARLITNTFAPCARCGTHGCATDCPACAPTKQACECAVS
jgi:hypothetical protein